MNFTITAFVISVCFISIAIGVSNRHETSAEQVTASITAQRDSDIRDMAMLTVVDRSFPPSYWDSAYSQRMVYADCLRAATAIAQQRNMRTAYCRLETQ
jgi:hypothetical protein